MFLLYIILPEVPKLLNIKEMGTVGNITSLCKIGCENYTNELKMLLQCA